MSQTLEAPSLNVLHADKNPTGIEPVAPQRHVARISYSGALHRPLRPHQGQWRKETDPLLGMRPIDAKEVLVASFRRKLFQLSELHEDVREKETARFLSNSSFRGYVENMKGEEVNTSERLGQLINAAKVTTIKEYHNGEKWIFFFAVPSGWRGYTSEVIYSDLVKPYVKKDKELKEKWRVYNEQVAAAVAAGTPVPPPPFGTMQDGTPIGQYVETEVFTLVDDELKKVKRGPWMTKFNAGLKVINEDVVVKTHGGEKIEHCAVSYHETVAMRQARTISVTIDKETGVMGQWQPGRIIGEMNAGQKVTRVTLVSGEISNDEAA